MPLSGNLARHTVDKASKNGQGVKPLENEIGGLFLTHSSTLITLPHNTLTATLAAMANHHKERLASPWPAEDNQTVSPLFLLPLVSCTALLHLHPCSYS